MEIVKLQPGERAPLESDCISIDELEDGRFLLNASVLTACDGPDADKDVDDDESMSVVGGETYGSYAEAEAAGLALAAERCVTFLYVTRDVREDQASSD